MTHVLARADRGGGPAVRSGLPAYDQARWRGWQPVARRVFVDVQGLSTLNQLVPEGATGTVETVVTPAAAHCLLLWRAAAPRLHAWVDDAALRIDPEPGQGILIPAGLASRWHSSTGNTHDIVHLHFAPAFLSRLAEEAGLGQAELPLVPRFADPLAAQLGFWLSDSLAETPGPSRLFWDSGALLLARRLLEVARGAPPRAVRARGGLAPWQLRRVTAALAEQAESELHLADLAALVGLSTFHFARAFRQSTGLPPHRYQLRLRVQRAQALLAGTDLTVGEVAIAVGYETPQTLARLFRREVGCSPLAWRRAHRLH